VRKTLVRSLAAHDVGEADGGRAGLAALAAASEEGADYDVVISDVMMPDGDGLGFYRAACEHDPRWTHRFVFVTGGVPTTALERALRDTGVPVLAKPVTVRQLWDAVHDAAALPCP
jgi:CheY-like chemotaxis protein